jgi:hypothetical protein
VTFLVIDKYLFSAVLSLVNVNSAVYFIRLLLQFNSIFIRSVVIEDQMKGKFLLPSDTGFNILNTYILRY